MEKKLSARRPFRAAAGETAQDDWEVNRSDPRVADQLAFLPRLKEPTNVPDVWRGDAWRRDAWRGLPPNCCIAANDGKGRTASHAAKESRGWHATILHCQVERPLT
ncbi:MAG TPA: hypothetical protein VGP86_01535 [Xanthobacteraceae bacterium]|nr:hypothetical protein [Xanthobacteraceae bacterium]